MNVLFFVVSMVLLSGVGLKRRAAQGTTIDREITTATKGIASILILCGHVTKAVGDPLGLLPVGWMGVGLFFFWSGYGMTMGWRSKPDYLRHSWKGRFIKIFVPFLVAAAIYTPVKMALGENGRFSGIDGSILVDYSWYVFGLAIFAAAFYLCFALLRKHTIFAKFVLIATVVLALTICYAILMPTGGYWIYSNAAFLIGIALCLFDNRLQYRKWYLIGCPILVLAFFVIHPVFQRIFGFYSEVVRVLSNNGTSAFGALFVVAALSAVGHLNKPAMFLGEISYEIYLMHGLFISVFYKLGWMQNYYLSCAIVAVTTVLAAIPLHRLDQYLIKSLLKSDG